MNYEDIREALNTVTRGNPLLAGGLLGGGLGLLGYHLGPKLSYGLIRHLPGGGRLGPMTPEQMRKSKRRMGLLGGALGMAPFIPAMADQVREGGLGELLKSYKGASVEKTRKYLKSAAWNLENIDADASKTIVNEDPYLPAGAKLSVNNIFDEAQKKAPPQRKLQGMLNAGDLIRGAVGAGLGYGTASIAGPLLRGIFGLPRGTQRKLSAGGGLAGLLLGSGIIEM